MELPPRERARLTQRLIASLDEGDDIEQAWIEEARRHNEQAQLGNAEAVPSDQMFARAREKQP